VTHQHLAFELFGCFERDRHHNEYRGRLQRNTGACRGKHDLRDDRKQSIEQRRKQRNPVADPAQILRRRLSGPDPGYEASVLLYIVRDILRIEGYR